MVAGLLLGSSGDASSSWLLGNRPTLPCSSSPFFNLFVTYRCHSRELSFYSVLPIIFLQSQWHSKRFLSLCCVPFSNSLMCLSNLLVWCVKINASYLVCQLHKFLSTPSVSSSSDKPASTFSKYFPGLAPTSRHHRHCCCAVRIAPYRLSFLRAEHQLCHNIHAFLFSAGC
jgi:hypothetical protein